MIPEFLPLGQGLPAHAEGANEWRLERWQPLRDDDRRYFERHRCARFIIRPWLEEDDPFGHEESNLLDMVGATIVFRSGYRVGVWDVPPRDSLREIVGTALYLIERCPSLASNAKEDDARIAASVGSVGALNSALQLSCDVTYVDAPGVFHLSEGLIVLRNFSEEAIAPFWRTILSSHRDRIRRHFKRHDRKRRWEAGLFARRFSFGLFSSNRRAGL